MPGDRWSYVIFRRDGLLLHTKPITRWEAWWLYRYAYKGARGRSARARYLEEWGNVLDVSEYADFLERLDLILYYNVVGIYGDPEWLVGLLARPLDDSKLPPEARQVVEELLGKVREFLARPVRPRPIVAPVRYLELPRPHVRLGPDGALREVTPRPEWFSYRIGWGLHPYGISVFKDSFWLWRRDGAVREWNMAVSVRRDAPDRDVVAAVANDRAVQEFLKWHIDAFRELLRESEEEMVSRGYGDVARKARLVLATYELLTAGRHSEGEELPA